MTRQTSIEAYRQIKDNGLLSTRRLQAYQIVFKYGPLTAAQLVEIASKKIKISNSGNFGTRLSELRDLGVIKEVKHDVCPLTGFRAIYWDVTNELPTQLNEKNKLLKQIEKAKKRYESLVKKFELKYGSHEL